MDPAVYLPALHQARGWSISTISAAITAHYLVSAALITALPEAYRRFGVGHDHPCAAPSLRVPARLPGRMRSSPGIWCRPC